MLLLVLSMKTYTEYIGVYRCSSTDVNIDN
jgi:hypothetical protein